MQIGMNLNLLHRTKTVWVMGAGEGLIATSASPIGAASAIASPWIAWIARAVECGIIAAQPTGDDPALGRGIIAPIGQEVAAWRAPICAAVLQTRHQQVANQPTAIANAVISLVMIASCTKSPHGGLLCIAKAPGIPAFVAESDRLVH
jgi:hypothetical protein